MSKKEKRVPGVEDLTHNGVTFKIWPVEGNRWKVWTEDYGEGWADTREQAIEMAKAAIDGELGDADDDE